MKALKSSDRLMLAKLRSQVEKTHEALSRNIQESVKVRARLGKLGAANAAPADIDQGVKGVMEETKSGAMADLLGDMWKEMRLFSTPFYEEQLHEQLSGLEKKEVPLRVAVSDAQKELSAFEAELGLV